VVSFGNDGRNLLRGIALYLGDQAGELD
jgi:hypothetical protein